MSKFYFEVFQFFIHVIQSDVNTLDKILNSRSCIYFCNDRLVFSLQGLLSLLDNEGHRNLREFKKLLYTSNLNELLIQYNAQISVYHSDTKVNNRLYCLNTKVTNLCCEANSEHI